jgi:hypothetical protein
MPRTGEHSVDDEHRNDGDSGTKSEAATATAVVKQAAIDQNSARAADFLLHIDACRGDRTGKLFAGLGLGPHWTEGGKYEHTVFKGKLCIDYPGENIKADVDWLLAQAGTADIYCCPNLMYRDRTPGSCVGSAVCHADWDGDPADTDAVLDKVRELGGWAIASGSPGHVQCYVPLAEAVNSAEASRLCKAFQACLPPGSDPSKHTVNDLLRPPGTYNHKSVASTGAPTPVEFLIRPGSVA